MKKEKVVLWSSRVFMGLSALSMLMVSLMAFGNPQAVMDLVQVKLGNTDAYSSIRGVYGGVGLTLAISIVYLLMRDIKKGLHFLALLWGLYAVSRLITIVVEGRLGAFGNQWLQIETVFCLVALVLGALYQPAQPVRTKAASEMF